MRFDDRLDTALTIDSDNEVGRAALWRQLVDMLAQSGQRLPPDSSARALAAVSLLSPSVPFATRRATVRAIAARCDFAPLAVLLAADKADIVVDLFDHVELDEAQWLSILGDIGPLARSRVRQRRDVPPGVIAHLARYHAADYALPAADVPVSPREALTASPPDQPSAAPAGSSIAELVQRIEAYRSRPANDPGQSRDAEAVAFRADVDGQIRAVKGLPRAAFVGIDLRAPARPTLSGVDAGVARAFAKRDHIRAGRLLQVAGEQRHNWLIDASPLFDSATGRFEGYSGTLSPAPDAPPMVFEFADEPTPARPVAEGMRQLLHELRSPLNAINGFAQLIQGQYFGPVGSHYRDLARAIIADADTLSMAFEDLDLAARMDTGALPLEEGESDLAAMVVLLTEGAARSVVVEGAEQPVIVPVASRDLHHLLSRLIRHVIDATPADAAIRAIIRTPAHDGVQLLMVSAGITGNEGQTELTDGGGDGAFMSLRLVERLAVHVGGSLQLAAGKALLNLPCATRMAGRFGTVE